jgi:hypothetical protein
VTALAWASACSRPAPQLQFSKDSVVITLAGASWVTLANGGSLAAGPVVLETTPLRDGNGLRGVGLDVRVEPTEVATLNPGASRELALTAIVPPGARTVRYGATLLALLADGDTVASVPVALALADSAGYDDVVAVTIAGPDSVRQGDVTAYTAEIVGAGDTLMVGGRVRWRVEPGMSGVVGDDGRFVGYQPGNVLIIATAGAVADTMRVSIAPRASQDAVRSP